MCHCFLSSLGHSAIGVANWSSSGIGTVRYYRGVCIGIISSGIIQGFGFSVSAASTDTLSSLSPDSAIIF